VRQADADPHPTTNGDPHACGNTDPDAHGDAVGGEK